MIKAALFDLDGVIFDTESQYSHFWKSIGKKYHLGIDDFEIKIKGQTLSRIFDVYFSHLQSEQLEIIALLNEFEKNMAYNYVPGIISFVSALKRSSIKTAIVTSSNLDKMKNAYRMHPEIENCFDAILTAENFGHSKPHPECYLKGAEILKVNPAECAGFEDSFNGLKALRAAEMFTVGLATTNRADAIADYCDLLIDDFLNWEHEIFPYFNSLLNF